MASLSEIYLKAETLETLLNTIKNKQDKGVGITISISDDTNEYGQNISAFVSQTKEQRESKVKRFYVGNGKVFWNDSKIVNAVKQEKRNEPTQKVEDDDLPF